MTDNDMDEMFRAFNNHDIDAVMAYFDDDIVFDTVSGDQAHGTRLKGQRAVREAFENTWGSMPDVQWLNGRHYWAGEVVVSESTFVATQPDGGRIEADGVDLFTLKGGKIVRKQAFRKQRPVLFPSR